VCVLVLAVPRDVLSFHLQLYGARAHRCMCVACGWLWGIASLAVIAQRALAAAARRDEEVVSKGPQALVLL
jgi:hypothetical protein